jgi:hypothetical protein
MMAGSHRPAALQGQAGTVPQAFGRFVCNNLLFGCGKNEF